ncbi:hypothetical protein D6783_05010 [Candidatus Woesearchaeota archaeon]|nr:MAG: hypothetical protein D6783_05010 [Candidatus Woesearchaeota archaeon]
MAVEERSVFFISLVAVVALVFLGVLSFGAGRAGLPAVGFAAGGDDDEDCGCDDAFKQCIRGCGDWNNPGYASCGKRCIDTHEQCFIWCMIGQGNLDLGIDDMEPDTDDDGIGYGG